MNYLWYTNQHNKYKYISSLIFFFVGDTCLEDQILFRCPIKKPGFPFFHLLEIEELDPVSVLLRLFLVHFGVTLTHLSSMTMLLNPTGRQFIFCWV